MGPKSKKPKKKEEAPPPPDEFDAMDMEKLQDELKKMKIKSDDIRRNRNYYQLERDQVQNFYDIVHDEVSKTQAHIRNIEAQMERMQDAHRTNIKVYLQRVIHLEYQHANNTEAVQKLGVNDRAKEDHDHLNNKGELKKLKIGLKAEIRDMELQHEEKIKELRENEKNLLRKEKGKWGDEVEALNKFYEDRLNTLRSDLELRRKMELHEIEERKNSHINLLMSNYDMKFNEMREYYNSITKDNLNLIRALNERIEELRTKQQQNEKSIKQLDKKNRDIKLPLSETEAALQKLKGDLQNYAKDQISLKHAKARRLLLEEQVADVTQKHRIATQQHHRMELERNKLFELFEEIIIDVQNKANSKNNQLSGLLAQYQDVFDMKKQQFTAVLKASNLDPVVLQNVTRKLDDVLTSKSEQIQELKYETAKVSKAHDDLVRVYEAKLRHLGVPQEELNLEPLLNQGNSVPADLIIG